MDDDAAPQRSGRGPGVVASCVALGLSLAAGPVHADAAELRERYAQLEPALRSNDYGRPLHIESVDAGRTLQGQVHAVVEHPFERVREAMREPARWCDILILPFNTKYCHAVEGAAGPALMVRVARRVDHPLERTHRLEFSFEPVAAGPDYFESRLEAAKGPVGTRDYRIAVAAVPLDGGRTFLRLSYSYGYGMAGKMAFRAYLATAGADKVGFTREVDGNGQRALIGGMRGAIERNAMRYYLAIDAYLDSLGAPPQRQAEQRIQGWFDATERYPAQLHEMDRGTYVAMKRMEVERQRTLIE